MTLLKHAAQKLFKKYSLYWVYKLELGALPAIADSTIGVIEPESFDHAADDTIGALRSYAGSGAYGFGAYAEGVLVAVCWYFVGDRDSQRSTWPISEGEAKLAQITTAERYRGQGFAPRVIAFSAAAMQRRGYRTLYARIWHSNRPSIRAFEHAGWKRIALVAEVTPAGTAKSWRLACRAWPRRS
ncbi:GNAT family N-acetyltransferase [Rhodospirillaceae bacterium SYSU D60014]|uniref:GNAT family N-acetyltransferase n=1 Tax=Virgifigura deserti TaxID=2268457 RepID=UPI0013C3F9AE